MADIGQALEIASKVRRQTLAGYWDEALTI
jgi:hypothetical protein